MSTQKKFIIGRWAKVYSNFPTYSTNVLHHHQCPYWSVNLWERTEWTIFVLKRTTIFSILSLSPSVLIFLGNQFIGHIKYCNIMNITFDLPPSSLFLSISVCLSLRKFPQPLGHRCRSQKNNTKNITSVVMWQNFIYILWLNGNLLGQRLEHALENQLFSLRSVNSRF